MKPCDPKWSVNYSAIRQPKITVQAPKYDEVEKILAIIDRCLEENAR